ECGAGEADAAIRQMAADLVVALQAPGLKLAAGLRTVGWLKRIVPDLVPGVAADDALPALFLVCRLTTLVTTLAALEPLRDLADEERLRQGKSSQAWSGGQQTERYLKRFIEVFREHGFAIVSMSRSVDASFVSPSRAKGDPLGPIPSALSCPVLHCHLCSPHLASPRLTALHCIACTAHYNRDIHLRPPSSADCSYRRSIVLPVPSHPSLFSLRDRISLPCLLVAAPACTPVIVRARASTAFRVMV
ncbi:oligomeric golgi complex subunit 8, partial [Lasius niger]